MIDDTVDRILKYDADGMLVSANLDLKNPNSKSEFEHLPPSQLIGDLIAKERKILEILASIQQDLQEA